MNNEEGLFFRCLCGIAGAILGALIVVGVELFPFDQLTVDWVHVGIGAAVCFVLAFLGGSRMVELLNDLWRWSWPARWMVCITRL